MWELDQLDIPTDILIEAEQYYSQHPDLQQAAFLIHWYYRSQGKHLSVNQILRLPEEIALNKEGVKEWAIASGAEIKYRKKP